MRTFPSRGWILSAFMFLAACGGGDGDEPTSPTTPSAFTDVDNAARAAYQSNGVPMGLAVYDKNGTKVFERMYGDFAPDRRVALASASKMVSGVTLFRLIDAGYLSLDSTTGEVLGWTGTKGQITLRHLLSFTSGLNPENSCTYLATMPLADCVALIGEQDLLGAPGTRFDYGSTHLQVAALMAEVMVGVHWNEIFDEQLRKPLQLSPEFLYYAAPRHATNPRPSNPLLAGGLRASMNDYASLLKFVYNKGQWQGSQLLSSALFDLQTIEPYPNVIVGTTPDSIGARYGLTAWLECDTPAAGCATISSPGLFGFTPWLDRNVGYYAILGMELDDVVADHGIGPRIEQTLKPLIVDALARM